MVTSSMTIKLSLKGDVYVLTNAIGDILCPRFTDVTRKYILQNSVPFIAL